MSRFDDVLAFHKRRLLESNHSPWIECGWRYGEGQAPIVTALKNPVTGEVVGGNDLEDDA